MNKILVQQQFLKSFLSGFITLSAILLFIGSCARENHPTSAGKGANDKYNVDTLTKDWHEQVQKNPYNPYENNGYPSDNDGEYYYPVRPAIKNQQKPEQAAHPRSQTYPRSYKNLPKVEDNEDSNYGKFPKYNPDDDNQSIDSKNYPLYLD